MTKRKPVAYFKGINGWTDGGELGVSATLYGVQHPKLGWEDIVYTSKVHQIHWDEEGKIYEIETKNTIYLRREEEEEN